MKIYIPTSSRSASSGNGGISDIEDSPEAHSSIHVFAFVVTRSMERAKTRHNSVHAVSISVSTHA